MRIRRATNIFEKTSFSSRTDFDTYPVSIYKCDKCGESLSFNFKDLNNHRFKNISNLDIQSQQIINELSLSILPKSKLTLRSQNGFYTEQDLNILSQQRVHLKNLSYSIPPLPKTNTPIPDSYIDFNCFKCKSPARVYYHSYLGGHHGEYGFLLLYLID